MTGLQERRTFKEGDIILKKGERGDRAYIIEDGQVEIFYERKDGKLQNISTRGPGAIIGEMAIVDEGPRVATVRALKDCRMLEITRDDFAQRLKTADPVIQMVAQVILTRFRDTLTRAEILHESAAVPPPELLERDHALQSDVMESVKIANEFKAALNNNQLTLNYQPIIDLANGRVMGFEALMRWKHPEKGFISPGLFIPVAEKSGLIVEASRWALKESCAALKRIEAGSKRAGEIYMSVNFSSHDFAEDNFVKHTLDTVSAAGLKPAQMKLEITERLLIQQPDNAKVTLQKCRDAGMGIAIDDFGTGYSSLSYLYYFPIETLKIDQSFIRAMYKDERSLELVKSIIGLGQNMGLTIVAEGVETREEAELLNNLGCESAQGYHFARPLTETDAAAYLKAHG